MAENDPVWLYLQSDNPTGPVTSSYLALYISAGRLHPSTLVWRPGMAAWSPAGSVAEIVAQCAPLNPGTRAPLSPASALPAIGAGSLPFAAATSMSHPTEPGRTPALTIEALARETKDSLTPAAVRPPAIGPAGGRDAYAAKGVFLRWAGWSFLIWSLVFVRMMVVDLKIGGLPLFFVTMMVVGLGGYFASEAYGRKEPLAPSAAGCVVGLIGTWLLLLLLVGLGEAVRSGR